MIQKTGNANIFKDSIFELTPDTIVSDDYIKSIYDTWLVHSNKKMFYGGEQIKKGLKKYIQSLIIFLQETDLGITSAHIRFHTLPPETLTIFTSADIQRQTGSYYKRNYTDKDDEYGQKIKSKRTLFMTVTDKHGHITPNINMQNLHNEYTLI